MRPVLLMTSMHRSRQHGLAGTRKRWPAVGHQPLLVHDELVEVDGALHIGLVLPGVPLHESDIVTGLFPDDLRVLGEEIEMAPPFSRKVHQGRPGRNPLSPPPPAKMASRPGRR